MPHTEQENKPGKLEKLVMKASIVFAIWIMKYQWRFLKFTGLWAVILVLMLDAESEKAGIPGEIWGIPFVLSLGFALFWTTRNILRLSNTPQQQQDVLQANGVFFGITPLSSSFWGAKEGNVPITKPPEQDGHILVVGGAGSGKSSCIAIPTLRDTWGAAALVVDIKGELYTKSQRPRAYMFNPLSQQTMGYDPFYMLRGKANPMPDIREIALTLCPMSPNVREPFWIQTSQNILTGHLLYCYQDGATFTEALEVLQSTPAEQLLQFESQNAAVSMFLTQYVNLKEETLSGVMAELSNKVMAFATDPYIKAALNKKDIITPNLLEQGYDIFLQIPEYKLEQWRPLVSLIIQQFCRHFEQRPDYNAAPILFMLDEFPRLGKMDTVINGLATLRSKKITIMPIIQSLAQLDTTYGTEQRKVIVDNCNYKAILGVTDADSQAYFSKLVGTYEREKITRNYEDEGWLAEKKGISKTTEEKPIVKPEEFAYLQDIVLITPYGYMRVQKRPYYLTAPQRQAITPMLQTLAPTPMWKQPTQPLHSKVYQQSTYKTVCTPAFYMGTANTPEQKQSEKEKQPSMLDDIKQELFIELPYIQKNEK
jgi:type IV secretion system protein VirD4